MDEEGVPAHVTSCIPEGDLVVICVGQDPNLVAGIRQLTWYVTPLTPWLSCQDVSESLQCQSSGHLNYHGDHGAME